MYNQRYVWKHKFSKHNQVSVVQKLQDSTIIDRLIDNVYSELANYYDHAYFQD